MDVGTQVQPAIDTSSSQDRGFAVYLMEHLVVPAFVIDTQCKILIWNKACERLTGIAAHDVVGTTEQWRAFYIEARPCLADLLAQGLYGEISDLYSRWDRFGLSDFGVSAENWCVLQTTGRNAYLAIDAGPIYDASGNLVAVVETVRDITAQKEAQNALEALAACDGLTGLANRRTFDAALTSEARRAARSGVPLSLLMMDIDHFKTFNDSYGHQHGDQCLKLVADAIGDVARRSGDVVARYGGEEFAVILPNTGLAAAEVIAERIRRTVENLRIAHRSSASNSVVTMSIGGATTVTQDVDVVSLVSAADQALYAAKRSGRNRIKVEAVLAAGEAEFFGICA